MISNGLTIYPKKYAHGFCFAVLCCGYKLTDFLISIRLASLALWQSNDCPSASKVTLMNMDKYFMWIHYERLHNHNKAKHNKTVCICLVIYCISTYQEQFDDARSVPDHMFHSGRISKTRFFYFCEFLKYRMTYFTQDINPRSAKWTPTFNVVWLNST